MARAAARARAMAVRRTATMANFGAAVAAVRSAGVHLAQLYPSGTTPPSGAAGLVTEAGDQLVTEGGEAIYEE